jgi:hypothetical protein
MVIPPKLTNWRGQSNVNPICRVYTTVLAKFVSFASPDKVF